MALAHMPNTGDELQKVIQTLPLPGRSDNITAKTYPNLPGFVIIN